MKMKRGKQFRVVIMREQLLQEDKKLRRQRLKEEGLLNIHKNKTMRSKKDYTRKAKHRARLV